MAVRTFLESYDFNGKTIIPFSTHEGSGLGSSVTDIDKLVPEAKITEGLAIRNGNENSSTGAIESWIELLGVLNKNNNI